MERQRCVRKKAASTAVFLVIAVFFSVMVWQVRADATPTPTDLHNFTGTGTTPDGASPYGNVIVGTDGFLYGMTSAGGIYGYGMVFKVKADGTGFTDLYDFAGGGGDGATPYGSLILSGNTLYGMTSGGGSDNLGAVFKINTDGSGYSVYILVTVIHPYGSLILDGANLYGMTAGAAPFDLGEVFTIDTGFTTLSVLYTFTGLAGDGATPYGSLTLNGGTLYGMTSAGGANGKGMIFSIPEAGGSLTILHSFAGGTGDGATPYGSLILVDPATYSLSGQASGAKVLLGMTSVGGANGDGTIFAVTTDGAQYEVLYSFAGATADGTDPYGDPTVSGTKAYWMTLSGGSGNLGAVFTFDLQSISAGPGSPGLDLGGHGSTGGCFIATAAYGSYLDPHVKALRDFRDRYLLTSAPGRLFVRLYYHYSPPVAGYIAKHETARKITRLLLTPVIAAVEHPFLTFVLLGLVIGLKRKRLLIPIIIFLLVLWAPPVYAGNYGPSEPVGKSSLGIGYDYDQQNFRARDFNFNGTRATFDDFSLRSNQVYLQGTYSFIGNWEAYLRLGGATARSVDTEFVDNSTRFFGAAGLRGIFFTKDRFSLGGFARYTRFSDWKDTVATSSTAGAADSYNLTMKHLYNVDAGLSAQYKVNDFVFYGGPVAYWSRATMNANLTRVSGGAVTLQGSDSLGLTEKANVGGFLGVRIPLAKKLFLTVETQYKERFGVGGVLAYAF